MRELRPVRMNEVSLVRRREDIVESWAMRSVLSDRTCGSGSLTSWSRM